MMMCRPGVLPLRRAKRSPYARMMQRPLLSAHMAGRQGADMENGIETKRKKKPWTEKPLDVLVRDVMNNALDPVRESANNLSDRINTAIKPEKNTPIAVNDGGSSLAASYGTSAGVQPSNTERIKPTAQPQELVEPEIRTAIESSNRIENATTQIQGPPPADPVVQQTPSSSEIMGSRATEQLRDAGVDVDALKMGIEQTEESLTSRKSNLSAAVRQVRSLRQQGLGDEADALANEIRLERQSLESDFKQNVANKRLLQGDQSMLTDAERAAEFESRRQSRIDLLERNLPLQRASSEQEIATARTNDANALDRYGLNEGSSPEEIDRATRGVGLPQSQVESKIQQLDRLNQFDIEGFVNKPITARSSTGRNSAIANVLETQRGPSLGAGSYSSTPGTSSPGDFVQVMQSGKVSTGDPVADEVVQNTQNGAIVDSAIAAVEANDKEALRAATTAMTNALNSIQDPEGRVAYARLIRGRFADKGLGPGQSISAMGSDDVTFGQKLKFGADAIVNEYLPGLSTQGNKEEVNRLVNELDTKRSALDPIGKDFFAQIDAIDPQGAADFAHSKNDEMTAKLIRNGEITLDAMRDDDRRRILRKFPSLGNVS